MMCIHTAAHVGRKSQKMVVVASGKKLSLSSHFFGAKLCSNANTAIFELSLSAVISSAVPALGIVLLKTVVVV